MEQVLDQRGWRGNGGKLNKVASVAAQEIVTHDECIFYAHDDTSKNWLLDDESILKKKGQGRSLMVSDFLCACHGRLKISEEDTARLKIPSESREIIHPGKNHDGYWKSDDMVGQLRKKAIPLFRAMHPEATGVFLFDQSTNHQAFDPTALVANRMTLHPKVEKTWKYKDGYYFVNHQKIYQPMFFVDEDDGVCKFKGIKRILEERGLWFPALRLECKNEAEGNCCARHILAAQPDFLAQKSALAQAVEESDNIFDLYPKYHCECNFIERYWGAAKRQARQQCDYKFESLKRVVPQILNEIPLPQIRRFSWKACRYIDAHHKGLTGVDAERAVKKFKSHRRIRLDD